MMMLLKVMTMAILVLRVLLQGELKITLNVLENWDLWSCSNGPRLTALVRAG